MFDLDEIARKAILASFQGNLQEAISLNRQIIAYDPNNLAALNRLGKCYFLSDDYPQAKKYYQLALCIDQYNPIARRNLTLLNRTSLKANKEAGSTPAVICNEFIEIPGKTLAVHLHKLTDVAKLCYLKIGQLVKLEYKHRTVEIFNGRIYVGSLPDDLSLRLLKLKKRGNEYMAYIKSVQDNKICLFIKEIKQSERNRNLVSFPQTLISFIHQANTANHTI
jgi:tetratricopeptide (TPR) repeat protein